MSSEVEKLAAHSVMLGQIAGEVSDWCISDECTTLDAVRLLKAEVLLARGAELQRSVENKYQNAGVTAQ